MIKSRFRAELFWEKLPVFYFVKGARRERFRAERKRKTLKIRLRREKKSGAVRA